MIPIAILAIADDDDREFMIRLYLDHKGLIYSRISSIVKNPDDAEDVMQDVVEKMIEILDKLRQLDHRALVSYLAEMAKNRAINYVRRADRRKVVYLGDCDYWEDSRSDVEDSTILKMELDGLQRVWNDLKPETQKILHMKYFLRMPDEDIAREFGIQPRSVRMRLTRARREAKEALERRSITITNN